MLTFADSGIGTEMAFVITGGIGVLFAITWFLIYNSPNKHPWITHKELRYIEDGQESYLQDDNKKPAVKEIVKSVTSGRWRLPVFWLTRHGER